MLVAVGGRSLGQVTEGGLAGARLGVLALVGDVDAGAWGCLLVGCGAWGGSRGKSVGWGAGRRLAFGVCIGFCLLRRRPAGEWGGSLGVGCAASSFCAALLRI